MRNKAIVLASGGVDSAVTLGIAALDYELLLMHFNYGQRTERRELKAFNDLAGYYGISRRLVVNIPELGGIGGSSLTDNSQSIPEGVYRDKKVPSTYVPFRNGLMLSFAAAWAEVQFVKHIFIGVVETDVPGYPDCSADFIRSMETAINKGRKPESRLTIHTPVIKLNKVDVVKLGVKLGVPFELTWSCYQREDAACGKCTSCLGRLEAFENAGIEDPIEYMDD
ncbi:7-cyano-7-deazaguanine synthase QueC [bacterium]|nr:7-cyano-7-deazaguanine synthase QueC [bacterium]